MGPPSAPSQPTPASLLDQYQAYLGDLGNFGMRYTTANGFYLSVITALLGILALAKPGQNLSGLSSVLLVVLPFFACLVCGVWFRTILFYREQFKIKL